MTEAERFALEVAYIARDAGADYTEALRRVALVSTLPRHRLAEIAARPFQYPAPKHERNAR